MDTSGHSAAAGVLWSHTRSLFWRMRGISPPAVDRTEGPRSFGWKEETCDLKSGPADRESAVPHLSAARRWISCCCTTSRVRSSRTDVPSSPSKSPILPAEGTAAGASGSAGEVASGAGVSGAARAGGSGEGNGDEGPPGDPVYAARAPEAAWHCAVASSAMRAWAASRARAATDEACCAS